MTDHERQLLQRLAVAGKATRLLGHDLRVARLLEAEGYLFFIKDDLVRDRAVITTKGRATLNSPE